MEDKLIILVLTWYQTQIGPVSRAKRIKTDNLGSIHPRICIRKGGEFHKHNGLCWERQSQKQQYAAEWTAKGTFRVSGSDSRPVTHILEKPFIPAGYVHFFYGNYHQEDKKEL